MSVRSVVRYAAGVVSVSTFVLLYFGLVDLSRIAGVSVPLSWLYPLAIDGMVAAGYAATLVLSGRALKFAWLVVGVGSTLSLIGQWLHAERVSDWAFAGPVAAAPALSMALVWHLLFLVLKAGDKSAPVAVPEAPEAVSEAVPAPVAVAVPVAVPAPAVAAASAPVARPVVSASVRTPKARPVSDTLAKAVAVLSAANATGERMTGALMAERLGLANAGTPSGNKTGQRWVIRATEALTD